MEFDEILNAKDKIRDKIFGTSSSLFSIHLNAFKSIKGTYWKILINLIIYLIVFFLSSPLFFIIWPSLYLGFNNFISKAYNSEHITVGDSLLDFLRPKNFFLSLKYIYSSLFYVISTLYGLVLIGVYINFKQWSGYGEEDETQRAIMAFWGSLGLAIFLASIIGFCRWTLSFFSVYEFLEEKNKPENKTSNLKYSKYLNHSITIAKRFGLFKYYLTIVIGVILSFISYGLYYPFFCYTLLLIYKDCSRDIPQLEKSKFVK